MTEKDQENEIEDDELELAAGGASASAMLLISNFSEHHSDSVSGINLDDQIPL